MNQANKGLFMMMGTLFMVTVFILIPYGMVQLNVSWDWPRWNNEVLTIVGAIMMIVGFGMGSYCTKLFRTIGKGTPVPTNPPQNLVISGLYKFSRNPIYVANVCFLLGLAVFRGEATLYVYTFVYAAAIQILILFWEEPELLKRFGKDYVNYMQDVPRWISLFPKRQAQ